MQLSVDQAKALQVRRQELTHESVLRLLRAGSKNVNNKRDTIHLSVSGRLMALDSMEDSYEGCSPENKQALECYFRNQNNTDMILNAVNFGDIVSGGTFAGQYGFFTYRDDSGNMIAVPECAIPKLNPANYDRLKADNNELIFSNKSFHALRANDGKDYVMTVHNGRVEWARSESFREVKNASGVYSNRDSGFAADISNVGRIITSLGKGKMPYCEDRKEVATVLRRLGVTDGEFVVDVGNGRHTYRLHENGVVERMSGYASIDEVRNTCEEMRQRNRERLNHTGNTIEFMNGYEDAARLSQLLEVKWYNDDFCFTGKVNDAEENEFNRQMINRQIDNILREAGIDISGEENVVFSIEPYEYRITVTGNIPDEKCMQIEQALNDKENGRNLYNHIYFCAKNEWENSTQLSKWGQLKRHMNDFFYEKLGVRLVECEKQGDDFITKDGESVRAMASHNDMYTHYLNLLVPHDYHDDDSQVLEIAYNSTGLHDLHQDCGYGNGDYGWIYDNIEWVKSEWGKEVFCLFV